MNESVYSPQGTDVKFQTSGTNRGFYALSGGEERAGRLQEGGVSVAQTSQQRHPRLQHRKVMLSNLEGKSLPPRIPYQPNIQPSLRIGRDVLYFTHYVKRTRQLRMESPGMALRRFSHLLSTFHWAAFSVLQGWTNSRCQAAGMTIPVRFSLS